MSAWNRVLGMELISVCELEGPPNMPTRLVFAGEGGEAIVLSVRGEVIGCTSVEELVRQAAAEELAGTDLELGDPS
jgi:hypothetical protein